MHSGKKHSIHPLENIPLGGVSCRFGGLAVALYAAKSHITTSEKTLCIVDTSSAIRSFQRNARALWGHEIYAVETISDLRYFLDASSGIFVASMDVFFLDLTLKKFLRDTTASFHVNQILSLREAIDILLEKEYTYDAQLDRPGTYRQQGDVLEIFPIFRQEKVRVSFFDTYIDGIFCVSARGDIVSQKEYSFPLPPKDGDVLLAQITHMLSRSDGGIVPFLSAKNVWFFGCDFSEYTDSLRSQLPPSTWLMYASHPEAYDIDSAPVHIGHRSNLELLLQDTSLQFVVLSTRIKSMMSFFEEHASGRCQYVHGAFSHESRRVENIYFLTDELLSRLFVRRSRAQSMGAELDLLLHIRPLDYVVHIDHGIGRFIAIVEKESIASVKEYLELHYRDDGKLFVPLTDISKITKYIGSDEPVLARLGSDAWKKTIDATDEEIARIAQELLDIHAQHALTGGFMCQRFVEKENTFRAGFPYEYTPDQSAAIEDILSDMNSTAPMDRLLSGDVGFGKTEVAMNAIYLAFLNGRQSLVLTPLVVLAYEHFETMTRRFQGFGLQVAVMTRMTTPTERKKIRSGLKKGTIHVIIGTHGLLDESIEFHALGLIVVDEEHKFGVEVKERFKAVRKGIDVLSLSATPIPRSLNMALSGVRKMSLLTTAPPARKKIATHVCQWSASTVKNAILQEMGRGGQVIILCNRIRGIEKLADNIRLLVPSVRLVITHADMSGLVIEDRIHDFKYHRYDILLSTTIIENGVNFLSANTIIIVNAESFGLAQLHQLRGRVGRKDVAAHCYLMYDQSRLGEDGKKRLMTIAENSELGSGFEIALRDMEIRGAGEILGLKQSGKTSEVGIPLYLKMLEESIHTLKTSLPKIPPTLIDLPVSWSFEESDFSSESDMIQFFRDVDTLKTHDDIDIFARDFSEHMAAWNVSSRASFDTLIRLAHVRVSLGAYGVSKLKKTERDIIFEFRVGVTLQNIRDFLTRYSDLDITLVGTERARIPSASIKDISEFLQRLTD